MRWSVALVVLAGCGRIGFDVDDGEAGGTGGEVGTSDESTANGDGGTGGTGLCPHTFCAFDGANPCSCWGTPVTSFATIGESGGSLQITPAPNQMGAQGACVRENVPFGAGGIIVEVSQVVTGTAGFTAVRLGDGPDSFQIAVEANRLVMKLGSAQGATVYNPAQMRFWRLRPLGTTSVKVQTSADGETWRDHISVGRATASLYTIQLIGGTPGGPETAPGRAVFESVSVCPP